MNNNIFCSGCHRVPAQCVCKNTKPLSEEEIEKLIVRCGGVLTPMAVEFARSIEEAHGIK